MKLYIKRMQPVWDQLKKGSNEHERAWNRALMVFSRKGEYLIKSTDKSICLGGVGYLNYTYRADGWGSWSNRRNAQWFTKEEALEITKDWQGVKIVKR